MGTPEMLVLGHEGLGVPVGGLRGSVMGSTIMPASLRFTLRTMSAWRSIGWFLWIMAIPPSRASAMASAVSDTVSMAAASSGMLSAMVRVRRVPTSVSRGGGPWTPPESRRTSSNESPSTANFRSQSITPSTSNIGFVDSIR